VGDDSFLPHRNWAVNRLQYPVTAQTVSTILAWSEEQTSNLARHMHTDAGLRWYLSLRKWRYKIDRYFRRLYNLDSDDDDENNDAQL